MENAFSYWYGGPFSPSRMPTQFYSAFSKLVAESFLPLLFISEVSSGLSNYCTVVRIIEKRSV